MIIINEEKDLPVCSTCKTEIEFLPCRIASLEDSNGMPKVLHFHYFFPCWDLDTFFQQHVNDKIISLAYSFDEDIFEKPLILRNFKNNLDLWY